jgi:hypothetical protein
MAVSMPAKVDIVLRKGAAFAKRIVVLNVDGSARDLTGYTAKMQIRQDLDDAVASLTLTSTPPAGLTVTAGSGYVDILITKAQTAALTIQSGVWDVWIDNGGSNSPEYLAEGGVTVRKMVTQ